MLGKLKDWLDHRTGYRKLFDAMLLEHIPGGAKWRYVWGSCLAFVFAVQLITGILLMTAYSPGESTAWGSVYFIQYEMDFGWLIRGLHHFGSQTMVVLLGLHMLQVVIAGAHLAPREINWWLGLALMGIVLGLSLTGYLLPWDQKGFFATQVATNIAGTLPVIGPWIQKVVVGGPEYGHQTLTHFYALHVGIFPLLMIALIIAHLAVFRRHGVTAPENAKGEDYFWPAQAFRDMVVCMLIFGVMLVMVVFGGHGHKIDAPPPDGLYESVAKAGRQGLGANLDAPADPATESYPARPEWYFLFLFQLLKYFEGDKEIIGTVVIPNGVMVLLFLLPLFGIGRMRKFGHLIGVVVVVALLAGVGWLTYEAMADDAKNKELQDSLKLAEHEAKRAVQLAHDNKIPEEGGKYLLRRDPERMGPKLFAQNCATCHVPKEEFKPGKEKDKAPDLAGFGTAEWNRRFLRNVGGDDFFGRTKLGWMRDFMQEDFPDIGLPDEEVKKLPAEQKEARDKDLKDVEALAVWLARHPRKTKETDNDKEFQKGLSLFKERGCIDCHVYEGRGGGKKKKGPELTGYGDAEWLRLMIMAPNHPSRYGGRNTMFLFRDFQDRNTEKVMRSEIERHKVLLLQLQTKPDDDPARLEKLKKEIEDAHKLYHLSDLDRELIIRWMTHDDRVIFSGDMVAEPLKR